MLNTSPIVYAVSEVSSWTLGEQKWPSQTCTHRVNVFRISDLTSLTLILLFYTPPHASGGVLCFHVGRPSVCPSVSRTSVRFSFPDDNLSKHQWIFTKLGMCIDMEIWFGIANGQIPSIFKMFSARDTIMAGYFCLTL